MHSPLRRIAAFALVVAFTSLAPSAALATVDPDLLPVGTAAQNFTAVDTEGKEFTLAEALKERAVLLVFWSLFCGTCREELPILQQEQAKFADRVQIVTVNLDEVPRARTVKGFAKQQGFTYRMLLNKIEGKEFQIDLAFQIKATPALYLINRDGTIAYGHYGAVNPDELAEIVARAR